jgi:DNA-binding GntR family transcriptional regulator
MSILQMIQSGELNEGDKIPTEKELCEKFSASRITVRRALKELEDSGDLQIFHGKGTFVSRKKEPLRIMNLEGFTEGLLCDDDGVTKVVLSKKIIKSSDAMIEIFDRIKPFELLELVREIRHNDTLFSVDYAYFPTDLYEGIDNLIKDNVSTYEIIHNHYGIKFERGRKVMEVIYPDEHVAEKLGVSKLDQVIRIKKVTYDDKGRPVHFSVYYMKTDSVKIYIDVDIKDDHRHKWDIPDL